MAPRKKTKNAKPRAKKAAPAKTAKATFKLKDTQKELATQLVGAGEDGLAPHNWGGDGKFPTRTFQAFAQNGLAKSKNVKTEEGKKVTAWFPTAKLPKVLEKAEAA